MRPKWSRPPAKCSTATSAVATKIVMEALSPTMEEGRLVAWRKKEGDAVHAGDTLAEVETDKAVMELVAREDGVLRKIVLAEGATVPVGALVAIVGAADEWDYARGKQPHPHQRTDRPSGILPAE